MNQEQNAKVEYYTERIEGFIQQQQDHLKWLGTDLIRIQGLDAGISVRMAEDWEMSCNLRDQIEDALGKLKTAYKGTGEHPEGYNEQGEKFYQSLADAHKNLRLAEDICRKNGNHLIADTVRGLASVVLGMHELVDWNR